MEISTRRRVLVVEDDGATAELLSVALDDAAYLVRTVAGGRRALSLARAWRPHLILLDLVMPEMDGWTFRAEQALNGLGEIPVLVLTAAGDPEAHARALAAPVLSKPFELDQLLREVERLLG